MSLNFSLFQKPSRYIGNELNASRKESEIKVALCFPDTYEIGMSHLGLKILYTIINKIPYASAERVFSPWIDLESYLRKHNLNITSLEHQRPLKNFDIVGFTLQYELSYTNVLNILDLGGIPIRSADRGGQDPVIIAGGPCTVNPLPLTPFIDAFVIGDGEEVIGEIIDTYREYKGKGGINNNRDSLLYAFAELPGVFVPSVHIQKGQKIKKRIVQNLDATCFPGSPVIPFTEIVHDRIPIEISRGCTRGCRFCQAGMIYRPLRKRSLENILSLAEKSLSNTGYEEISFTSLSTGDYPDLLPLLRMFNASCKSYPVAVSLPSLRVGSLSRDVLKEIKNIRKTGFTIAPEAGTQRLRNVINKNFTEKEYRETLRLLFKEGWHHLKLYFMIGLPSESRDDIEGIMDMAEMALKMGKETTGRHININMGISAFVPKPHTPFQWLGQLSYGELRSRQDTIRNRFKKRGINVKGQHIELSLLEAVFSRADHTCASLLEHAWRLGCRFDGWSESFDFQKWLSAAKRTGMNLHEFAERSLESDSVLPWDFIDIGITKAFLLSEFERSQQERTIPDCKDICRSCGLECNENTQNADHRSQNTEGRLQKTVHQIQRMKNQSPVLVQNFRKKTSDFSHLSLRNPHSLRMRIRFSKTGLLRYLSHREIISAFIRAMHRENVPLLYSEGFHPHPRVSFGPPLPVGVEGINEFLDIELRTSVDPSELLEKMNSSLPPGLKVFSVMPVDKNKKSLNDFISRYEYKVAIEKSFIKSLSSFLEAPRYNVAREKHDVDIRPMVEKAEITNGSLKLILVDTNTSKVRLYEILRELLHKTDGQLHKVPIQRLFLYGFCKQRGWIDPQEDEINEQRDCN